MKRFRKLPHDIKIRVRLVGLLAVVLLLSLGFTGRALANHRLIQENTDTAASPQKIKAVQKQVKNRLQRYADQITADKTASVYFYNLTPTHPTKGWSHQLYQPGKLAVSSNAHAPVVAASTYKLYMAGFLFSQAKAGNFVWNSTNENGFRHMIVNSENDFAESELDQFGLAPINSLVQQLGGYTPTFIEGQSATTTATSLGLTLRALANKQSPFQNTHNQQWLLKLMGQQIYRKGIPAGATAAQTGSKVADKVGFFADENNDAGIVTLPNGQRYILVVMTHGHQQSGLSGFPRIATITKQIQEIVYGSKTTNQVAPRAR